MRAEVVRDRSDVSTFRRSALDRNDRMQSIDGVGKRMEEKETLVTDPKSPLVGARFRTSIEEQKRTGRSSDQS
jgi:hypothetical protein